MLKGLVLCGTGHFSVTEINGSKWCSAAKVRKWDVTDCSQELWLGRL